MSSEYSHAPRTLTFSHSLKIVYPTPSIMAPIQTRRPLSAGHCGVIRDDQRREQRQSRDHPIPHRAMEDREGLLAADSFQKME